MRVDLILVGFGNVARCFVRLLGERAERLRTEHDLTWRVIGIATRRHGWARSLEGIDVARALELVESGQSLETVDGNSETGDVAGRVRGQPHPGSSRSAVVTSVGPAARAGRPRPRPPARDRHAASAAFIRETVGEAKQDDPAGTLVVVETTVLDIERGQPAIDHVRTALESGAHVITANKGPAAFAARELMELAERHRRAFFFEGAVMDGVPVFNLVRETLPAVSITGFRGVVNATTNYIITAMEAGREFDQALAEMQEAGVAEADASFDIDGWDAAAKAAALINVLMKGQVTPHSIDRTGIGGLTGAAVRDAFARRRRIKLVASAGFCNGQAFGRVAPEELPAADLLASLDGQQNALVLQTDLLREIAIVQRGAGLTQTAYALLSDLVAVRHGL